MGYESKIYFCKKYEIRDFELKDYFASEIVASIDMCKMGYSPEVLKFRKLFNTPVDFALYLPGCDENGIEKMGHQIEDCYGDKLCYGDYTSLKKQMKKVIKESEEMDGYVYWRFKILYKMLKAFEKAKEDIYVVHYGY